MSFQSLISISCSFNRTYRQKREGSCVLEILCSPTPVSRLYDTDFVVSSYEDGKVIHVLCRWAFFCSYVMICKQLEFGVLDTLLVNFQLILCLEIFVAGIAPNSEDSCLVHIFRLRQALMDSIQFCLAVITLGRPTTTY
ncbi:hypothetical protein TNCT_441771 [Trichonephila clavata]|uniref:Uncharacterized protein n=1 Tax=Trichonephila clavata TaxID=2740835 RepID=A0A8X6GNS8_TRICU|nr:hypothetical protein TNCT_441771 [Trichonephila clavata]